MAAVVALPVRVVGDVTRWKGDGVIKRHGVVAAGRWVAVVRVQGHAVGAVGVDGEGFSDGLPYSCGLDGLFLRERLGLVFFDSVVGLRPIGLGEGGGVAIGMYLCDGNDAAGSFGHRLSRHFDVAMDRVRSLGCS